MNNVVVRYSALSTRSGIVVRHFVNSSLSSLHALPRRLSVGPFGPFGRPGIFGRRLGGTWFHPFAWLIGMCLLAAVIALVIWTIRAISAKGLSHYVATGTSSTPEQILAERLARGDITPEDYASRLNVLRQHTP